VIATAELEVRAGARLLMADVSIRIGDSDRVGLVGRNGAGKTTLMRILAGETAPEAGSVTRSGSIGYLPQDPRTGNLEQSARERILDARGLRDVIRRLRRAEAAMGDADPDVRDDAMRRYDRAQSEFLALDGYAAEAQAAAVAAGLGITERNLESCSARRARCCSTSPRTTSTPTPSCGCAATSPATRAVSW
jgi:ATPase subunit of ABC transporter with duplicated ATPase domains